MSAVAHVFLLVLILSMLPARTGELRRPSLVVTDRTLEVHLIRSGPPPEGVPPGPPDRTRSLPESEPAKEVRPETPRGASEAATEIEQSNTLASETPAGAQVIENGGVYLGDESELAAGVPLGLRGLLETDPCESAKGIEKRGNCYARWAERYARGGVAIRPSMAELEVMYPAFQVADVVDFHMGGPPVPRDASVFRPDRPSAPSPSRLGGINDAVGRLPPAWPDPGFGD